MHLAFILFFFSFFLFCFGCLFPFPFSQCPSIKVPRQSIDPFEAIFYQSSPFFIPLMLFCECILNEQKDKLVGVQGVVWGFIWLLWMCFQQSNQLLMCDMWSFSLLWICVHLLLFKKKFVVLSFEVEKGLGRIGQNPKSLQHNFPKTVKSTTIFFTSCLSVLVLVSKEFQHSFFFNSAFKWV